MQFQSNKYNKVLSVVHSCHYNENLKNGKHRLETNVRRSRAAPTNPCPSGKSLDAKAPGWGQSFGANPWGCVGRMIMDEIDTCITNNYIDLYSLMHHFFKDNLNSEAF